MSKYKHIEKLVPDTSIIIDGLLSQKISKKEISPEVVIIHEAIIAELEHQANMNRTVGFLGLDELANIRKLSEQYNFRIEVSGRRPTAVEIKHASAGEIDSLIRQLAYDEGATLITADKVQARVSDAVGIPTILVDIKQPTKSLRLESFFDETTMSVHLRENVKPHAKKGFPGSWQFVPVSDTPLSRGDIQEISKEIIEEAEIRKDGFIEIERHGSTIVQLGSFRVVITRPPFSDGWEITAVRPVKRLSLDDYKMSEKLRKRIAEQAEGILIAGSPGMGKSTFAQALAEYYASRGRIVKTVEAPRDLVLTDSITQYAISHGDAQEIHDILLLSRPDNTIFDEMRNTADFQLFADLRLAGIGLAGVVHATNPIDAIQRFVGRIELGVIPQVIDTVIFIKNGAIEKVLSLNMVVKVPSGMTEADLARPVVVVTDFETKKLEFELYSYGEETVVVPVKETLKSPLHKLATRSIEEELKRYASNVSVEIMSDNKCVVYVPESDIPRVLGKQGSNIDRLEKKIGMKIDVRVLDKKNNQVVEFDTKIGKRAVQFLLSSKFKNRSVDIYVNDDYLLSAKVGANGVIKIKKNNRIGKILVDAINTGENIKITA